jgi:hypothetical protein
MLLDMQQGVASAQTVQGVWRQVNQHSWAQQGAGALSTQQRRGDASAGFLVE